MAPALPVFSASDDIASIADALLDQGGVIVEGFLTDDVLVRFNRELEPFVLEADNREQTYVNEGYANFYGPAMRHVLAVAEKSDIFIEDVLCHPIYIGLGDLILKKSCTNMQLNVAHVLERKPGARAQYLHRDHIVWPDLGPQHPHRQISSVIALSEFTTDMGATLVIPGSHKWDPGRKPKRDEVVAAEMQPGSAVIYLGGTIHAGGSNATDIPRRGAHLSYCLGWLRTEENNYLSSPPAYAATLPRVAQELLGYAIHDSIGRGGGYLGMVRMQDPVELLARGELSSF